MYVIKFFYGYLIVDGKCMWDKLGCLVYYFEKEV